MRDATGLQREMMTLLLFLVLPYFSLSRARVVSLVEQPYGQVEILGKKLSNNARGKRSSKNQNRNAKNFTPAMLVSFHVRCFLLVDE